MGFSSSLDDIDAAVAEALTDPALWYERGEGAGVPCAVILESTVEGETLQGVGVAAPRVTVEVQVVEIGRVRIGDVFVAEAGLFAGRQCRVCGAPTKPGDGRWWRAEVEDRGPA